MAGESLGDLTDDAWAVLPHDFKLGQEPGGSGASGLAGVKSDLEAEVGEFPKSDVERVSLRLRELDAHDAGELTAQPGEPAFQPVTALIRNAAGDLLDDAGTIRTQNQEDKELRHDRTLPKRAVRATPKSVEAGWSEVLTAPS